MLFNQKHKTDNPATLRLKAMYLTSTPRCKRMIEVLMAFAKVAPSDLALMFEPLDQEIIDVLNADITAATKRDTENAAPILFYRQAQRMANVLWDFHSLVPQQDATLIETDMTIYKSLVNLMMALEFDTGDDE